LKIFFIFIFNVVFIPTRFSFQNEASRQIGCKWSHRLLQLWIFRCQSGFKQHFSVRIDGSSFSSQALRHGSRFQSRNSFKKPWEPCNFRFRDCRNCVCDSISTHLFNQSFNKVSLQNDIQSVSHVFKCNKLSIWRRWQDHKQNVWKNYQNNIYARVWMLSLFCKTRFLCNMYAPARLRHRVDPTTSSNMKTQNTNYKKTNKKKTNKKRQTKKNIFLLA